MLHVAASVAIATAVLVGAFSLQAFVTLGPKEEPRDSIATTPFAK